MILTDTHTHIYSEEFEGKTHEHIEEAIKTGVQNLYVPSIDSSYNNNMKALEKAFPDNVKLMIGLHPCYVKENYEEELAFVFEEVARHNYYAIGEIGIDLYWDKSFLKQQQNAFQRQIKLAKEKKLPINIHCRDAFDEIFEILEQEKSPELWGIFHCFTGNKQHAEKAIDCGMKLGIGGVVTFKNGKIDQFLNEIAIEHIVLETDAPYLAPAPHRGKQNRSAYIAIIAEKVAAIYGKTKEEIAAITTKNALDVFQKFN